MSPEKHISDAAVLRGMRLAPMPCTGHYPEIIHGATIKWVLINTLECFHDRLPTTCELAELTHADEASCALAMRQLLITKIIRPVHGGYDFDLYTVTYLAELHDSYLSEKDRQKEIEKEHRAQLLAGELKTPTVWTAYDYSRGQRPLPAAGVYAFYCDGVVTYIGSSLNVRSRLKAYRYKYAGGIFSTPWGTCYRLILKVGYSRSDQDWLTREARLIKRLKPRGNIRGVPRRVVDREKSPTR